MSSPAKRRVPKCHRCGEPFERKIAPPRVERMKYDGARHDVLVEGVPQWQCEGCGITATDDDSDTVVQDCLRRHIGLISANEIREGRTALGLTQTQLAGLLGCAAESLSRWENGAILQSRSYDRLLRLFFHLPRARDLLRMIESDKAIGRVAVPGPRDPPPEGLEALRILTRIWDGSAEHVEHHKVAPTPGPQKSKERGSELGVWMEAQRRNSAAGVGWSGPSPKNARGVDPARATWEPS
jgi:putative zinc finger/helix-turn-helix YgiT family protein